MIVNASFLDSQYSLPPRGLPGGTKEAPGELGQQENHWRLVLGQRECDNKHSMLYNLNFIIHF